MRKLFLLFFLAGVLSTGFISCRETAGDQVEDVADDIEDAVD